MAFARRLVRLLAFAFGVSSSAALAFPQVSMYAVPATIDVGGTTRLQVNIYDNFFPYQTISLGTIAPGAFIYPAGVVNAPASVVSNTCGGVIVATPGANTLTATGISVPAGLSCTFEVDLTTTPIVEHAVHAITLPAGGFTALIAGFVYGTSTAATTPLAVTPPLVVINTNDSGPGSLREMLTFARDICPGFYGGGTVRFNIPGPGPHTIMALEELPSVICPGTLIDGYTQPGSQANTATNGTNNATIKIAIDGINCIGCNRALGFQTHGEIRGLAIYRFESQLEVATLSGSPGIYGNYLGTDPGGSLQAGGAYGIRVIQGSATIGRTPAEFPGDANLITDNSVGIQIDDGGANITGNLIGGTRGGAGGVGNSYGVVITGSFGSDVGENFIRHNFATGVYVVASSTGGHVFRWNSMSGNGGPGIDLGGDGVTSNDESVFPYDTDTGPNGLLNYPVITSVSHAGGNTLVEGYIRTSANQTIEIELFHNTVAPAFGKNQGEKPVASFTVEVDVTGEATFAHTIVGFLADNVSATASQCGDGCFRTSEYSPPRAVAVAGAPTFTGLRPGAGSTAGGSAIAIDGTNLDTVTSVTIDGSPAAIVRSSSTMLMVTAPPHAAGFVTVVVTSPTGSATQSGAFEYVGNDNVARDYSVAANPSPRWSYGWSGTLGGAFNLYSVPATGVADSWSVGAPPAVYHNYQAVAIPSTALYLPGAFWLHPGPNFEYSIARWTAPAAGDYHIIGNFNGIDSDYPTSTDVHILRNNNGAAPLFSGTINSFNVPLPFLVTPTLAAGETIEFLVGPNGTYYGDSTGLAVTISPVALAAVTCNMHTSFPATGDSGMTYPPGSVIAPPDSTAQLTVGCSTLAGATYLWSNGDTTGYTTVATPSPGSNATYSVTVNTTAGVGSASVTLQGAAAAAPICTLTPSVSLPLPATFASQFTVSASCSPTAGNWVWNGTNPAVAAVAGQGTDTATYQVSSAGPGYGYTVVMTPDNAGGTGPNATRLIWVQPLTISPTSLTFPDTMAGTYSAPQAITISNVSDYYAANASVITAAGFPVTDNCPSPITPGVTCQIYVYFGPEIAGAQTGTLTLSTGFPGNSDFVVLLSGNGLPAPPSVPTITLTPSSLVFATRTIGTTSAVQTSTLTNNGPGTLDILSISVFGDYAFTSMCPASLAAGATCDIEVTFTPLDVGTRTGSLTITSNASGSPHTLSLSGAGQVAPIAGIAFVPSVAEFTPQLIGSESPVQIVTVFNDGTAPLAFEAIAVTGDFAITLSFASTVGPCGLSLARGASCEIWVVFRPTAAGLREGALEITSNAPTRVTTLLLVGTGLLAPPPRALTVPASLAFDPQRVGTRSAGRALAIVNNLPAIVSITELTATGDFSVSDTCTTIAARGNCSPLVTFQPRGIGERSGTLTIRALSELQPYVVQLRGLGLANPLPALVASISQAGFGNAFVGSAPPVTFNLRNIGQVPVVIESIAPLGDFFATHACDTIAAGESCPVTVHFMPRGIGRRVGALIIRSNAEASPLRIDLSGTGCAIPSMSRSRFGGLLCGP